MGAPGCGCSSTPCGASYLHNQPAAAAVGFSARRWNSTRRTNSPAAACSPAQNSLSLTTLQCGPELVEVLDFVLASIGRRRCCSNPNRAPTSDERGEAGRFLDLVEQKKAGVAGPGRLPAGGVADHAKEYDAAADTLRRLLDPETPYQGTISRKNCSSRRGPGAAAAPGVVKRIGWKELDRPGRRVEAIGAVERQLAHQPERPRGPRTEDGAVQPADGAGIRVRGRERAAGRLQLRVRRASSASR